MQIIQFNEKEAELINNVLVAVLDGHFFPDWEFYGLIGIDRDKLHEIIKLLPNINYEEDLVLLAINNSILNLLYYPHGFDN